MWTLTIVYLLIYCVYGSIWGIVVKKVIENRGYRENWFWWGFFFGFFALIVAITKPQKPKEAYDNLTVGRDYVFRGFGDAGKDELPDSWKCQNCGKINASYVGTCGCGCDKNGNMPEGKAKQVPDSWKCQNCGKINASYVGTCGCGCDKNGNMPDGKTKQAQLIEPQTLYCTSCGKPVGADSKFCRYCGAKID